VFCVRCPVAYPVPPLPSYLPDFSRMGENEVVLSGSARDGVWPDHFPSATFETHQRELAETEDLAEKLGQQSVSDLAAPSWYGLCRWSV